MSVRIPKYRLHKGTGQALVQINRKRTYLGKHGSPESHEKYRRLVAEWLEEPNSFQVIQGGLAGRSDLTMVELMAAYLRFAKEYYVKNGKPTDGIYGIKAAFRPLRELYGSLEVRHFGPNQLKTVRQTMIDAAKSRRYINDNINRIRRMFRWGVENEILLAEMYQRLLAVTGLKKGRSAAREKGPIKPVKDEIIELTLPDLSPVVRAMVQFQRRTGCRPCEVRIVRPCDVDVSEAVWVYRPESHKTEHYDRERRIFIGPQAQEILGPFLDRPALCYCLPPSEAVAWKLGRKTSGPRKPDPDDHYTKDTYRQAIRRACERAGVPPWAPNQIRHSCATELRSRYGLGGAQTVLGHSQADVTQIYAERDFELAKRIIREVG